MLTKSRKKRPGLPGQGRQRSNSTGSITRSSVFRLKRDSLSKRIPKNFGRFLGKALDGDVVGAGGPDKGFESFNWKDETGTKMMVSIPPDRVRGSADESQTDGIVLSLLESLDATRKQGDKDASLPETIMIQTTDSPRGIQEAQNIVRDLLDEQSDQYDRSEPEIVQLDDGKVGVVFTVKKASGDQDHVSARNLVTQNDLRNNTELFTHFGGGVNKQAFGINGKPWVALVAPASKRRIIRSEVSQILALKEAGVDTPLLGATPGDPDSAIFDVTVNGEPRIAFLEEKVDGFEIPREGKTAFDDADIRAFGEQIVDFLGTQNDLATAQEKRKAALNSIAKLERYFNREGAEDIPDFQVRLDKNTGRILTLDPGDPQNSENALDKHKRWLNEWKRTLSNDRYMSRIWNQNNPGKKTRMSDWNLPK